MKTLIKSILMLSLMIICFTVSQSHSLAATRSHSSYTHTSSTYHISHVITHSTKSTYRPHTTVSHSSKSYSTHTTKQTTYKSHVSTKHNVSHVKASHINHIKTTPSRSYSHIKTSSHSVSLSHSAGNKLIHTINHLFSGQIKLNKLQTKLIKINTVKAHTVIFKPMSVIKAPHKTVFHLHMKKVRYPKVKTHIKRYPKVKTHFLMVHTKHQNAHKQSTNHHKSTDKHNVIKSNNSHKTRIVL